MTAWISARTWRRREHIGLGGKRECMTEALSPSITKLENLTKQKIQEHDGKPLIWPQNFQ